MLQDTQVRKIVILVGVSAILALLMYSYTAYKETKYLFGGPASISVQGTGEVFAKPDIATFSFTLEAKEDDATTAQNSVSEKMESIEAYLRETGIDVDKDVKTQYFNLNPRYEYPTSVCNDWGYCPPQQGEPKLIGYEVSQTVVVKVRDTEKAGEIISNIGSQGALNVSGLSFTIDDEEVLIEDAREKAIEDARAKAKVLADNLDSSIVRMNGYWEENNGYPIPYGDRMESSMSFGSAMGAPDIKSVSLPTGENTITVRVNISYEIR